MKILITGANGFLGSHLCLLWSAIPSDHVVAGIRKGANTENLDTIKNLEFLFLDYTNEGALTQQFRDLRESQEHFDLVIHNAGLTKSPDPGAFYKVNLGLTVKMINALKHSELLSPSGKLVYISSMAAIGPRPFSGPVSSYGLSKLQAEKAVREAGFSYLIFRPTALYGPFDYEFLPLFKTVKYGFFPILSRKSQKITLLHGADAALNIMNCSRVYENETVHLVSEEVFSHLDMKDALCKAIRRRALSVVIPQIIVRSLLAGIEKLTSFFGKDPVLPLEKYNEISGDWDLDLSDERRRIPLEFNFSLNSGFSDTLAFYKSKNLI